MKANTKKLAAYTALIVIIGGAAFYASMEDYQKENMSNLVSQLFS
ncbi:hypothetical protein [Pseudidiomarina salilacus]